MAYNETTDKIDNLNVSLLLDVRDKITEVPARLRMSVWRRHIDSYQQINRRNKKFVEMDESSWGEPLLQPVPDCHSIGCIFGWAGALSNVTVCGLIPGGKFLGIFADDNPPRQEVQIANQLAMVTDWPEELRSAYLVAKTPRQRARLAGKAINAFIIKFADRLPDGVSIRGDKVIRKKIKAKEETHNVSSV